MASAWLDLHSIFKLAAGLYDHRAQLPLAIDFYFFQNVDFGSSPARSRMQHGGDCPSSEDFAQNTARMDTKVDTKPEKCGHQDGHQAAKLLRRKELVPKKGLATGTITVAPSRQLIINVYNYGHCMT
jgi:hypothetical protein